MLNTVKNLYSLSLLLLIANQHINAQVTQPSSIAGTLIVVSPTRDGIVVCADKRLSTKTDVVVSDSFKKLHAISHHGLFAATGSFFLTHSRTFPTHSIDYIDFALVETIDHYFQSAKLGNMDDELQRLAKEIVNKLQKIEPEVLGILHPTGSTAEDNFVFQCIFIFVDQNRVLRGKLFICWFDSLNRKFVLNHSDVPAKRFHNPLPITMGGTDVYQEILSGNDKRFNDVRADKRLKQFASGLIPLKNLNAIEAAQLARRLVNITSQRAHLFKKKANVSLTSDCALLSFKGSIKWMMPN